MKTTLRQLTKNAMQSGRAKEGVWLLEFLPETPMPIDPLMGWSGMVGTEREVKLKFPTKEAALAYALANGLEVSEKVSAPRRSKLRAYADNFKFARKFG